MASLNEKQFTDAARAMAATFLDTVARSGLSRDDTANLAGAALAEILAQQLGPFGAVERLRDIADRCELQTFGDMGLD